jgi:Helix-turn-helix domain
MHAASKDSERIQRIVMALRAAGSAGLTPFQLNQQCGSTRASSDVSECRHVGYNIRATYERETEAGRRVWRYRIVEEAGLEPVTINPLCVHNES